MLSNRKGAIIAEKLPKNNTVKQYLKNDILISNIRPYLKKIWFADKNGGCSEDIIVIRSKKNINPKFLYYSLSCDNFFNYMMKYSKGTKMPRGDKKFIKKYNIKCINYSQQEKIVDFLTKIDEKINLLEKTYSLYIALTNSLQKVIYSSVNDSSNNISKFKLSEIVNYSSSNLTINDIEKNNGNYPIYGADGLIKSIDFYELENQYISIIKDGASVGRLNFCDKYSSTLSTLGCLIPKNDNVNIKYLYYALKQINFKKYVVGSTIPHLYFKDYSKETIKLPSREKQNLIANLFTAIDKKMEEIDKNKNLLILFKKELLNTLFI